MPTSSLADEQISAIRTARTAGKTVAQISEELGLSEHLVKKHSRGVERPAYAPLNEEIVKAARRDYAEDKTTTVMQLSERYGGVDPLRLAMALKGQIYGRMKNPRPFAALRPEPELQDFLRQRT